MTTCKPFATLALSAFLLTTTVLAQEHHHHGAEGGDATVAMEKFGQVDFRNSCSAAVQKPIARGIALLHSFWYEEAFKQFQNVATADPHCAIAQWGLAMTEWRPLWDGINEARRSAGIGYIDKATALNPPSARERQYIADLSGFLHSDPKQLEAATATYTNAMGKLHAAYPQDTEAAAFYALALIANIGATDPVGDARKALVVLQPEFAAHPDHPGFAHYIVHTCDMPQLAAEGLPAAQRYLLIAPSSPHALHMPGHIFARLGMWQEDIDADEASAKASDEAEKNHQGGVGHQMHAKEFLIYAYLQDGDDANAKRILDNAQPMVAHLTSMPDFASDGMAAMTPLVLIEFPGIYHLERREWKEALALPAPKTNGTALGAFAVGYADWVHAIAAGHLHDAVAAKAAATHADQLIAQVRAMGIPPAVEIQLQTTQGTIHAWLAFAEGNTADALKQISAAADLQDRFGQGEVDIPIREMYADMLLELNRPAEALVQYRTALKLSPNRFNGLYNAGIAAEGVHDDIAARGYYSQLLATTHNGARTRRPEIRHAQELLKPAAKSATGF